MSTALGKRKRVAHKNESVHRVASVESDSDQLDAQEIFRRHFEAQFKPLPVVQKEIEMFEVPEEESEEESDWDGISDGEENGVQVVEHTDALSRMAAMSKEELKSFMSSKIPKSAPTVSIRDNAGTKIDDEDASEAANLKKDLALQRLLAESHLLESSKNPTLSGNNRHKATDLRLQALGSKESILRQAKMPMSHRKGIISKQSEKEAKRRSEARENGIILEKAKMGKKSSAGKRDRGIGAPGVGRFSGGTLTLSKKDIYDIEGPKRTPSTRGRGGGRGGGRGRGKRG
ncbi:hypothetical protein ONS95_008309 [Cadophora gregata]|uniref:uncharacterized protein n=1 Tax=Cadophora gregata TaxID=51156 RepID=UPI0026DB5306|nr:uncharacterized protein ONS95_008309 [Cadophora gregata]KAK0100356.1 hypothetical protein ONS96_007636 [Cadophora gregata f. sp. sojae]KAK0126729.1 hypothetical protein ONS95_008309 [Cadophora gregata]